jgi:heme/copper-type cytochrome/quinol oxidase subunit 2
MTIQDPATDVLEWMIDLYDLICFELIVVVTIVLFLLLNILFINIHHDSKDRYSQRSFSHSTELEVFWTIIPALLLISIAYPSFNLLYALDDDFEFTDYAIIITGHQWYWTYEYQIDDSFINYDSYILSDDNILDYPDDRHEGYNLSPHMLRLLAVDNRLHLPIRSNIQLLITSADVLHSWTVPSLGIKVDACPGRLTRATLVIKRAGIFYGQCSEICGTNHAFMPIVIEAHGGVSRYADASLIPKQISPDVNFLKIGSSKLINTHSYESQIETINK